ncbi:MAG: gamma carbonic anhydrase family protein [Bacteroidia bacterium]|nr:gamma carbonic anhydrase family protein [Bacteroidia bacterium]
MPLILSVNGKTPQFGKGTRIAPNATVCGDVITGDDCSIWFNAVIRGDVNYIRLGHRVNIQDGAVLHCTYQRTTLEIGDDVSVGHNAIVHGAKVESKVLIGMGAIVMDGCVIGSGSIIAAGAVLTEGTVVPSGSIFAGVPAKKIKDISPELFKEEVERIARNYIMYSSWFDSDFLIIE